MSVVFSTALLCDHIRQEVNGKLIAIGIYTSNVVFGAFPVVAQFQILALAKSSEGGSQRISVRVMLLGQENQRFEGELELLKAGEDWLSIPLQPIQFQVPGPLTIEQDDGNGEWREFFRINVERPTGPQIPNL